MKLLMLVTNGYSFDPRVQKEALTLASRGDEVRVLAWDREGRGPESEMDGQVRVQRFQLPSSYGLGLRQVFRLPRFWWWALLQGRRFRPEIVHCHDFDTLPAGFILSRLVGAKLVYDAHEHFPSALRGRVPEWLVRSVEVMERLLACRADLVITVGERLASRYPSSRTVIVGNWKDQKDFQIPEADRRAVKAELDLPPGLTLCYLGGLSRSRAILPLLEAAGRTTGVNVIVAGSGPLEPEVARLCSVQRNCRFLGRVPSDRIPLYTAVSDVVYYCLEPWAPNNWFSAPNKLYEALAAEMPILCTAGVGEIADIVERWGCGVMSRSTASEDLVVAIQELKDPGLYRRAVLGAKAAYPHYCWLRAEANLTQAYNALGERR